MKTFCLAIALLSGLMSRCANASDQGVTQKSRAEITLERQVRANGRLFTARLLFPWEVQVYEHERRSKRLILRFDDYANMVSAETYFRIADVDNDGNEEIAFKACKGHFCPSVSSAILYEPGKNRLIRLDYDESKGVSFSGALNESGTERLKNWLLNWWREWPGSSVR